MSDSSQSVENPIQNPNLLAAMDAFTKDKSAENQKLLVQELQKATYLVPILPDEETPSGSESEGGTGINVVTCRDAEEKQHLPLFTDSDALNLWSTQKLSTLVMPGQEVWEFASAQPEFSGIVINPADRAIPISKELIDFLKAR